MPVPTSINDLSQTAGSNYPAGSESPITADDYFQAHASFLAVLRDNKKYAALGVCGLAGINNAAAPLTSYDLTSALSVTLRDSSSNSHTVYSPATLVCAFGTFGANGRDQAGAFAVSRWIYIYYIWNGTTLASLASLAAPSVGPTLPAGYTHYCFATSCRWNASSNIVRQRSQGCTVWYELDEAGSVLSAGAATSFTAVDLTSFVPPIAILATLEGYFSAVHNGAGSAINAFVRPNGSVLVGNANIITTAVYQVATIASTALGYVATPVSSGQQIDYKLSGAPSVSGGLYLDVHSYTVPNGDS